MSQAKICVLFLAHYLNSGILKEFYKLKECRRPGFDVKFFYDNSRGDFQHGKFKDARDYVLFTMGAVQQRYTFVPFCGRGASLPYGNLIFPVLSFALDNPYQYVWQIEHDVRFSGDWADFFAAFDSSRADLLGTTLCRFSPSSTWSWWKTAQQDGKPIPREQLIRGFFPIIRLSRKACTVLDEAYHNGWRGHYEVTVGTILHHFNCAIEDIGGSGEFVRPENKGRFYTNTPENGLLWPGTFVWRLPKVFMEHAITLPDHLYHPVKSKWQFLRLYCARETKKLLKKHSISHMWRK